MALPKVVAILKFHTALVVEENGIKIVPLTPETIPKGTGKAYAGFLGMKGKVLKSLMEEKPSRSGPDGKREREL